MSTRSTILTISFSFLLGTVSGLGLRAWKSKNDAGSVDSQRTATIPQQFSTKASQSPSLPKTEAPLSEWLSALPRLDATGCETFFNSQIASNKWPPGMSAEVARVLLQRWIQLDPWKALDGATAYLEQVSKQVMNGSQIPLFNALKEACGTGLAEHFTSTANWPTLARTIKGKANTNDVLKQVLATLSSKGKPMNDELLAKWRELGTAGGLKAEDVELAVAQGLAQSGQTKDFLSLLESTSFAKDPNSPDNRKELVIAYFQHLSPGALAEELQTQALCTTLLGKGDKDLWNAAQIVALSRQLVENPLEALSKAKELREKHGQDIFSLMSEQTAYEIANKMPPASLKTLLTSNGLPKALEERGFTFLASLDAKVFMDVVKARSANSSLHGDSANFVAFAAQDPKLFRSLVELGGEVSTAMAKALPGFMNEMDPETIAWAKTLPNGSTKAAALASVCLNKPTLAHFQEAVTALGSEASSHDAFTPLKVAGNVLSGSELAAAKQWILTQPPNIQTALASILTRGTDSQNAKREVLSQFAQQTKATDLVTKDKIFYDGLRRESTDHTEPVAWAMTLPEGKLRQQLLNHFSQDWAESDPVAMSSWLTTVPQDTPERDGLVCSLVRGLGDEPDLAWNWAQQAKDAETRLNLLRMTAADWLISDPSSAKAVLPHYQGNEEERQLLQTLIEMAP